MLYNSSKLIDQLFCVPLLTSLLWLLLFFFFQPARGPLPFPTFLIFGVLRGGTNSIGGGKKYHAYGGTCTGI
jgi:hypothetical protein